MSAKLPCSFRPSSIVVRLRFVLIHSSLFYSGLPACLLPFLCRFVGHSRAVCSGKYKVEFIPQLCVLDMKKKDGKPKKKFPTTAPA